MLTEALKKLGKTQIWLAEKLGENPKKVNNWVTGRVKVPEKYHAALKDLLGDDWAGGGTGAAPLSLPDAVDQIEVAVIELARRGVKPPTKEKAHELRKLIAKVLEQDPNSPVPLADRVAEWIRMAEAIRK